MSPKSHSLRTALTEVSPLPTNKNCFLPYDLISLMWSLVQCTSGTTHDLLYEKKKFFRNTLNNVTSEFTKIMYLVTVKKVHCDSLLRSLTRVLGVYCPVSKHFSFLTHLALNLSKLFYNKVQLFYILIFIIVYCYNNSILLFTVSTILREEQDINLYTHIHTDSTFSGGWFWECISFR